MFGFSSLISCCMLSGIMLLIAEICHSCFACHLQTVHPIPVIFISISTEITSPFQWHTWFAKIMPCSSFPSGARICIAYHILHIMPCFASCCLRIASWLIIVPLLVSLPWVEPGDEYVNEEPVENTYEDQAFDNSENFAGKMTIPSKSLLSLLARLLALLLCLCCDTYHLLIMPPILLNQASNPPCPSKPLFGYVTALLSPSYSVVSCR